jgi:hypothetical protein
VLTSVPWIVVMLGVGLLTSLLIFTLFSVRGQERAVPAALDPPIYLPTAGAQTPTSGPQGVAPPGTVTGSPSSTMDSPSPTPSPTATSTASAASTPVAPAASSPNGTVTARYVATGTERDSFEARLTVSNGSSSGKSWEVELIFAGNVKDVQASSTSGVSARAQGGGAFVLRGTGPLPSGKAAVVSLRFTRMGTGDQPGRCTVNGTACVVD